MIMVIIADMKLTTIAPGQFFFFFAFNSIRREKRKMQANRVHEVKTYKKMHFQFHCQLPNRKTLI